MRQRGGGSNAHIKSDQKWYCVSFMNVFIDLFFYLRENIVIDQAMPHASSLIERDIVFNLYVFCLFTGGQRGGGRRGDVAYIESDKE